MEPSVRPPERDRPCPANTTSLVSGSLQQTKDYSFIESRYGKRQIVLGGYSFRRKSAIPGKSYWLCCTAKCNAKGTLLENGTFQLTSPKHNHKPEQGKLKRQEELVWLKKLALQVNISGQELLQALDIKDDIKKNLEFIRTCRKRDKNRVRLAPLYAGLNYKHMPTRYSQKGFLCHSGYIYRKDSVNPRDENCKYWKCTFENCKARAKTDGDGNLTILNPLHNHSLEETSQPVQPHREEEETEEQNDLPQTRKSGRFSRRWGKIKSVSQDGAQDSSFCSDTDSFNLDKLMAATLDEDYCVAPEISG